MRQKTIIVQPDRRRSPTTVFLRYYEDWADFVSSAELIILQADKERKYNGHSCASLQSGNKSWYGTDTLEETIRLAKHGWPDGLGKFRDLRNNLDIQELLPFSRRLLTSKDVTGDEVDVGLYLSGEPENMITMYDETLAQRGKIVRLIPSWSINCFYGGDQIIYWGVGVLLAVETLIKLGYSVEINLAFSVSSGYDILERYVPILHPGEPIVLDTLVFMLVNPSVLRRLRFAADECESPRLREEFGFFDNAGYGYPQEPRCPPEHDLIIKGSEGMFSSPGQIIPFVFEILRQVGVEKRKDV